MIHLCSLDSFPYRPRFKCGAEAGALAVGGVTSLIGSAMTNDVNKRISNEQLQAQREENQINRDYNTAEAEKARQFTTSERLAQQKFQTGEWSRQQLMAPQLQREGLEQAGINPGVYYGQSSAATGSSVNPPSGASSPAASFSTGLSPVPYQAMNPLQGFNQVAQGVQSLATAKEKGANVDLILKQIDSLSIDMEYKQVLKEGVHLDNRLKEIRLKYEDRRLVNELVQQSTDILVGMATANEKNKQAAYLDRLTKLQDSVEELNHSLADYHDQQASLLRLDILTYFKRMDSLLRLQGAQANEANAKASESSANAYAQQLENNIKSARNEEDIRNAIDRAKQDKLLSDQEAAEAIRYLDTYRLVRGTTFGRFADNFFEYLKQKVSIFH